MPGTLVSTYISLMMGATTPAAPPAAVTGALRQVEVIQGSRCPSGFRLTFTADRYQVTGQSTEYPLLDTGLLDPFVRVQVIVTQTGSTPVVLIDGFITRQEVAVGSDDTTTVTVIGEDLSIKMDLIEISAEFPSLADSAIVSQILGNYSSLGITASVTAPTGESAPQTYVPQQNCTDRYYVQMLAARHGFQFFLQPGASAGQVTAYWGPPVTTGTSQKALTANMSKANTIKALTLSYDALAPSIAYGQVLDLTQSPAAAVPVAISSASSTLGLSATAAIGTGLSGVAQTPSSFTSQLSTLTTRGSLLFHPGYNATDAQSLAQAKTNRSVQEVVVVEGELDTAKYEAILVAPGLVDVRGVGGRYDGTYYVKQVNHSLALEAGTWVYSQKFQLVRDGFGTTIQSVSSY